MGNYTWKLDQESFDAATQELFRREDDIPLRHLLDQVVTEIPGLVGGSEWDELTTLVGRVASLAALALRYERSAWFGPSVRTLLKAYQVGFETGTATARPDGKAVDLWLIVLEHVISLGGLAVRCEDWDAVRTVVIQQPVPAEPYYPTWLRHGLTMASRANRFEVPGGGSKSLLTMSGERAAVLPALSTGATDDEVLTSLCQFDMLAALVTIDETGTMSESNWYTNFARFSSVRSEPMVQRLLSNPTMRATVFPSDDELLVAALQEIDRMARSGSGGWEGYESDEIKAFLETHTRQQPRLHGRRCWCYQPDYPHRLKRPDRTGRQWVQQEPSSSRAGGDRGRRSGDGRLRSWQRGHSLSTRRSHRNWTNPEINRDNSRLHAGH